MRDRHAEFCQGIGHARPHVFCTKYVFLNQQLQIWLRCKSLRVFRNRTYVLSSSTVITGLIIQFNSIQFMFIYLQT
jgi:hypothetical protein